MKILKFILFSIIIVLFIFKFPTLINWLREVSSPSKKTELTWEECIKNPKSKIQMTYPGVCHFPNGQRAVEPISEEDEQKLLLPTQQPQSKLTLEINGYGYVIGDIVQIKKGEPSLGDVVIFDPFKNKSMCLGMGPSMSLGKIAGLPGETFSFQNNGLKIRSEIIKLDRDYSQQKAVFGGQKYNNLSGEEIILKNGEYLADKWVGLECFTGETDETGSSLSYNRFTINEEAILGIIEKKIGHDSQVEKEIKNRVY